MGGTEGFTEPVDILIELIVLPSENMIFQLHMLFVVSEVFPANLAVVGGRNGCLQHP